MKTSRFYITFACLWPLLCMFSVAKAQDANAILEATGVKGGLIVHIGCGDGTLTAALRANDSYIVHGLDADPCNIKDARAYIQSQGLYGKVSVERWSSSTLPYIENLVNLVVSEDLGGILMDEVMRVLAPGGVACIWNGSSWDITPPKPRPVDIDEWTHYLHDASGNAVADDTVVGHPHRLQWVGGLRWDRNHDFLASISVVVSSGGRIFYIADETPPTSAFTPKWMLIAMDAFNGTELWKKPIPNAIPGWERHLRNFRSGPTHVHRRLVAVDDRVYVTLGYGSSLTAMDAATGDVVITYAGTEGTEEIVYDNGVLFVVVGTGTDWVTDELISRRGEVRLPSNPKCIKAINADTGALLWQKCGTDLVDINIQEIMPQTLAVSGGRVFLLTTKHLVCLDRDDGSKLWVVAQNAPLNRTGWCTSTLVVYDNMVFSADRTAGVFTPGPPYIMQWNASRAGGGKTGLLRAYSVADGNEIWNCNIYESYNSPVDVLITDGLLWTGHLIKKADPGITQGRNPYTGVVERTRSPDSTWINIGMGHHRCYRNKATANYLVLGRAGVEFVDVATGVTTANHWVRGTCQSGVVPCNGLLYAPSHSCVCYQSGKIIGFNALAPEHINPDYPQAPPDNERLEEGPAYGEPNGPPAGEEDWPTYRHDAAREGYIPSSVSTDLCLFWQTQLEGKLTSPIIANGRVYVASVDMHTVYALNEADGNVLWSYTAGGRVDSPPTVYNGRVLFGSADGWVYCLRASDGALVWRFQAAPEDLRVGAYEQLESVWPVPGSVLVHSGYVYFAAGRSSFLDGGMFLYKLDAVTGQKLVETCINDRDANGLELQSIISGTTMNSGALPDVLSSDGSSIFLRQRRFNLDGAGQAENVAHIYSTVGFLDDAWWHRTYWQFGTNTSSGYGGWINVGNKSPSGRLLVADDSTIYGFGRTNYTKLGSHIGIDGTSYQLFSAQKSTTQTYNWTKRPPSALAWGMVLTDPVPPQSDKTLFVAGTSYDFNEAANFVYGYEEDLAVDVNEAMDAWECKKGGLLLAMSAADGDTLAEYNLEYPPVWDGMAAANGRLYLCLKNGKVQCLAAANYPPIVDAGEDQTIYPMATAMLDANIVDDGRPPLDPCDPCSPPIGVTTNWTKFDGPGQVTFDDPCAVDTNASFSQWGRYTLRLTAFDGGASNYDDTNVFVCRPGDMDCDNDVDGLDMERFAAQWLSSGCDDFNDWCSGADQKASGSVSFGSYAVVASNWLLGVEPAAPTNLVAIAGDSQVSLDWDDNTEADLAGYNVYRSTSRGYVQIASGVAVSDYVDNTVTNDVTYYYLVTAVDTAGYESGYSNNASATPSSLFIKLAKGIVTGVGSSWQTVTLPHSYNSMVVVATPNYDVSTPPAVVRIRNASGSSFEVRVDPAGGATPSGIDVHYMVVEEGVYTIAHHGVKMEAVKYLSTVTDNTNSWVGQAQSYSNSYSSPVVLGQVMSYNDSRFSAFWCCDGSRENPPSGTALNTGKMVGEDTVTTRADETLGYIVIEADSGSIEGVNYVADLGPDIVQGVGNSPPYVYSISGLSTASVAVATQAAMDGSDGGRTTLYGANPVSTTAINLAEDEDVVGDTERSHTAEQVGYIVFE